MYFSMYCTTQGAYRNGASSMCGVVLWISWKWECYTGVSTQFCEIRKLHVVDWSRYLVDMILTIMNRKHKMKSATMDEVNEKTWMRRHAKRLISQISSLSECTEYHKIGLNLMQRQRLAHEDLRLFTYLRFILSVIYSLMRTSLSRYFLEKYLRIMRSIRDNECPA